MNQIEANNLALEMQAAGEHLPAIRAAVEKQYPQASADKALRVVQGTPAPLNKFKKAPTAAQIKPQRRSWLWQDWFPLGALSVIYGEEGLGKGNVTMKLAADVSTGHLPGELEGKPSRVAVVTYEDSPDVDIVPRLIANNANLDMIDIHADGLVLPDEIEGFFDYAKDANVRLVIVDPLGDSLREGLKDNNNADVRTGLVPFQQAAEQAGIAAVGVLHPNKGSTTAANKLMGSKAWRSVPRAVAYLSKDPNDPESQSRVLAMSKRNSTRHKNSMSLRIESVKLPDDVRDPDGKPLGEAPGVVWGEPSKFTDEDLILFSVTGKNATAPTTKAQRAERLILQLISEHGGQISATDAYVAGDLVGIDKSTMKRARKALEASGSVVLDGKDWKQPE